MPQIPIIMPQLGESIAEATIVSFLIKPGDQVEADQDIIEVETSKATMNVASPCAGKIEKFLAKPNESYPVGTVLGYLQVTEKDAIRHGLDLPSAEKNGDDEAVEPAEKATVEGSRKSVQPTIRGLPVPANAAGASYMSPRMKARIHELGLHAADLAGIAG
ncbi:MAG: biotin/lipoyl-containing protein, partial [Verrucomicrobiota bacterium]